MKVIVIIFEVYELGLGQELIFDNGVLAVGLLAKMDDDYQLLKRFPEEIHQIDFRTGI